MPTKAEVERWRAMADAASPGPWGLEQHSDGVSYTVLTHNDPICDPARLATVKVAEDACHVAASREAVPAMAEMLARAACLIEYAPAQGWARVGDAEWVAGREEWLAEWRGEVDSGNS